MNRVQRNVQLEPKPQRDMLVRRDVSRILLRGPSCHPDAAVAGEGLSQWRALHNLPCVLEQRLWVLHFVQDDKLRVVVRAKHNDTLPTLVIPSAGEGPHTTLVGTHLICAIHRRSGGLHFAWHAFGLDRGEVTTGAKPSGDSA
ncbi:MAG: hypothetical protein QOI34_1121 [Verrucomicrobiota bacterium]|jgi:hypothetical protein